MLLSLLIIPLCLINFKFANAKLRDPVHIIIDGGGGTPREAIRLMVNAKACNEIEKFATISNCSVQGYNSIYYPIDSRPNHNSNYNSLDHIIYMIKQLEKYAEPLSYDSRVNINNYVLGYIRGINLNYTGATEHSNEAVYDSKHAILSFFGFDYWQVIAGAIDWDFVNNVNVQEADKDITLKEFFSSYLSSDSDYNNYLHADRWNHVETNKKLSDPLGSGQYIDLIHMMASIDGIYESTNFHDTVCNIMLGNKHFQRDIVTWLGDLQTLARDMAAKQVDVSQLSSYSSEMGHIDFNNFISNQLDKEIVNFSSDDLLADIDAFNIANFYLNNNSNSLSDAIIGYYTTLNKDGASKGNRYSSFIFNVTLELNSPSTGNRELDFINEVCNAMNVKYENGVYSDNEYFSGYNISLLGVAKENFSIRKYCAKLFCDYIIAMSHVY